MKLKKNKIDRPETIVFGKPGNYVIKDEFTRLKDNMGNMSYDIFYSFYRRRNKKLLELSIQTYILDKFIVPADKSPIVSNLSS